MFFSSVPAVRMSRPLTSKPDVVIRRMPVPVSTATLPVLFLCSCYGLPGRVEHAEARAGRALIDGADVVGHGGYGNGGWGVGQRADPFVVIPARARRSHSHFYDGRRASPPVPALMLGGKLEGYIEQLHDGQSDDHIGRNFHPSARFAHAFHYFGHVGRRLH